jgi:hypothetical protein
MQNEYQTGPVDMSTLGNLNSYFVLQHAEKQYGWTPEKAGISNDQATAAAALFARFDGNEDYRLEMSEFKRLCDAADFTLTDEEVAKAMELLDKKRGNGYIEFDEFVSWWVNKEMGEGGKGASNATAGSDSMSGASEKTPGTATESKAEAGNGAPTVATGSESTSVARRLQRQQQGARRKEETVRLTWLQAVSQRWLQVRRLQGRQQRARQRKDKVLLALPQAVVQRRVRVRRVQGHRGNKE